MQQTPEDKIPTGPVPQSAQQHGGEQIGVCAKASLSVSAERDVQILLQPGGQGHVPRAPEIADIGCKIGEKEVCGNSNSEQLGDSDGDVTVT